MKKNWKIIVICCCILLLLAGFSVFKEFQGRIPSNDITVTGNTGGNLNNHGLFAEADGRVYFSNAYDGGCLYSMNPDETDLKKLTSSSVNSINVGGNYLYYYLDNATGGKGLGYVIHTYGVYRSKPDGSNSKCLDRQAAVTMQLAGDYIYYQRYNNTDFTKFYKIKTDKSGQELVSDEIISPNACHNGVIYYNGTDKDHNLYALDTRSDSTSLLLEGNICSPVYAYDYIYYMDASSNYRLCRYSLSTGAVEVLTEDRVDTYNVGIGYVYYQKNDADAPALMRMEADGSNPEVVALGIYSDINLTSQYAYFHEFNSDVHMKRTPHSYIEVSDFNAAKQAAMASD